MVVGVVRCGAWCVMRGARRIVGRIVWRYKSIREIPGALKLYSGEPEGRIERIKSDD